MARGRWRGGVDGVRGVGGVDGVAASVAWRRRRWRGVGVGGGVGGVAAWAVSQHR